jgi:hypothetical protein
MVGAMGAVRGGHFGVLSLASALSMFADGTACQARLSAGARRGRCSSGPKSSGESGGGEHSAMLPRHFSIREVVPVESVQVAWPLSVQLTR